MTPQLDLATRSLLFMSFRSLGTGLQAQQGEDTGPGDTVEDALQTALHAGATCYVIGRHRSTHMFVTSSPASFCLYRSCSPCWLARVSIW